MGGEENAQRHFPTLKRSAMHWRSMSRAARVWTVVSAVPLAVMVQDQVLGIAVVTEHNGGAGMHILGAKGVIADPIPSATSAAGSEVATSTPGRQTPKTSVLLCLKRWTFRVRPVRMDEEVVVR